MRYQELKRKVLANESLTAEEAICYALTRDCNVLPANLKQAMQEVTLDKNTHDHLELILASAEEINLINTLQKMPAHSSELKTNVTNLLARLQQHHPHRFVNLLAGVNFSGLRLIDVNFSHLNLRGVKFNDANLSGAIFRNAYLSHIEFNGVLLKNADFTDAELRGIKLNKANLEGVDLSAIILAGIDLEWAFISEAKLLPAGALNSPEELHIVLSQFEKNIAKHSTANKRKLEEHILQEIAHQLELSPQYSLKEKIVLLDVAMSVIKPNNLIVGIFPFQNACQELKEKLTSVAIPEHPVKKETQEIMRRIWDLLGWSNSRLETTTDTTTETQRTSINKDLYRQRYMKISLYEQEYILLMKCLAKYRELNDGLKVANALGISPEMWYVLYLTCPNVRYLPMQAPPILADCDPKSRELFGDESKHYASEVFNGFQFDLQHLQQIELEDLDNYLYEEEDFVISSNGRNQGQVKLGDLFVTFWPEGGRNIVAEIEIIDFEKRERKSAFPISCNRFDNIPFEAFLPFDLFNSGEQTVRGWNPTAEQIKSIQEGLAFKKQIIERVFASEKINRNRKKNQFFPIFEQHEAQGHSQLALLPEELLEVVCAHVHANTFKQRQTSSPLAEVYGLHGLFFKEKEKKTRPQEDQQLESTQPNASKRNALKPTLRMFPAADQQSEAETQRTIKKTKTLPRPIAIDATSTGSCLIS